MKAVMSNEDEFFKIFLVISEIYFTFFADNVIEKSIQTETCKKKSFDPTVYNLNFNIKNIHT